MLMYLLRCNFRGCKAEVAAPKRLSEIRLATFPQGWVRVGPYREDSVDDLHLCPEHAELLQVGE